MEDDETKISFYEIFKNEKNIKTHQQLVVQCVCLKKFQTKTCHLQGISDRKVSKTSTGFPQLFDINPRPKTL